MTSIRKGVIEQSDNCRIRQLVNLLRIVIKDHEEFDGLGKVLLAEIETVLGERT
jgi:hypothetical protein